MSPNLFPRITFHCLCLVVFLGALGESAGAAPALFKLSPASSAAVKSTAGTSDVAVVARQGVEVDAALLAGTRTGDALALDLPGGLSVEGIVRDVHTNDRGARVYSGTIRDRDDPPDAV